MPDSLRRSTLERKTPLKANPERQREWERRSRTTAAAKDRQRPTRTISPSSVAQRAKVRRMGGSIVSGETAGLQAAHVWPRGRGGCDHPECVVPLTREEHRAYDDGRLDLLPHLIAAGCVNELQHALGHARGDLIGLLHMVTGERFVPERGAAMTHERGSR